MKILYFTLMPEWAIGVHKKINAQVKSLTKITNTKVIECKLQDEILYFDKEKIGKYNCGKIFYQKIMRKIEEYLILKKLQNKKLYKNIDIVYIRRFNATNWSINYLKFLKGLNKKIILEIATYPYDKEALKESYFVKQDRVWREEYHKYIDKIVTFSEDKKIWNIPCINLSNGIDLEEVKLIKKKEHEGINFISVSQCHFWHGIDRFLYSLLQYKKNNGKEKIKFYIVGEGTETPKLKKIVDDNVELQDIVVFHGFKSGEELDEIYNNSDIALGSLGRFRSGLDVIKTLKNREYCAKGLPMIYSETDLDFEEQSFIYKVSHNESLIDIEKIIEWYKNLKVSSIKIREYSKQFSWDIQMKKILDEIKES